MTMRSSDAPKCGVDAFLQGWDVKANPFEVSQPEYLEWIAAWHGMNAMCFRSHVESREFSTRENMMEQMLRHPKATVYSEGGVGKIVAARSVGDDYIILTAEK